MNFKKVSIKNFRNFHNVTVNLSNKNIFFGLNDVGKTNFLYALRYVFDKDVRKNGFVDTDYHQKNTKRQIQILVEVDISDENCNDNKKLRAQLKGGCSSESDIVYIKLVATYDKKESIGMPIISWGSNIKDLQEIKSRGYMFDIDYVFDVVYIDSYVELFNLFKKNVTDLIKNDKEQDKKVLKQIKETMGELNDKISKLSGVKQFEDKITPKYKKFRSEDVSIAVKSEIAIKGLYSNIVPYIMQDGDDNLYPTSGDGRKKLLAYSVFDLIAEEKSEKKIVIYLIEEPENHLHRSMQIALSNILFSNEKYMYLFIATHSPYVLYEMNKVNLVRIYNTNKINATSTVYKVPEEYQSVKKLLNRNLSEAIFAEKVLLIEGPSEMTLFETVLSVVEPFYESKGTYLLAVGGIAFEKYCAVLKKLGIIVIVKTDNDLRSNNGKYSVLGFSRCNKLIGKKVLPTAQIKENSDEAKKRLYLENSDALNNLRTSHQIYLSKVDLENDLDEVLHDNMCKYLGVDDPVKYLKNKKHYNMAELVAKLTVDDCEVIIQHYNFACLKEII